MDHRNHCPNWNTQWRSRFTSNNHRLEARDPNRHAQLPGRRANCYKSKSWLQRDSFSGADQCPLRLDVRPKANKPSNHKCQTKSEISRIRLNLDRSYLRWMDCKSCGRNAAGTMAGWWNQNNNRLLLDSLAREELTH